MSERYHFPNSFLWGAATSSYQIEGSPLADGAGASIWHRFSHTPGLIENGDTGDIACDHYRRYASDVELMSELGLKAYRFSIAWGRVLPDGFGRVNPKGLDFYSRLTDALLEKAIIPSVTLYHWDLPAALDDQGGWLNRDSADWFADYASVMFGALGDRVKMWTTINEPWVVSDGGYLYGKLAPGHRNLFEAPLVSHNLLRAHGQAVQAFRSSPGSQGGRIGIVVNLAPKYAGSDSPEDVAATVRSDAYMNRQYLDPVFLGRYPDEMKEIFGEAWPTPTLDDMQMIAQPIDFLGVNYYTREVIQYDPEQTLMQAGGVHQEGILHTETHWEVYPPAFTRILLWVKERYGKIPLYVTENGAAFYDPPMATNGVVDDPLRVDYLRGHLRAVADALQQGVNVCGYFVWSLLDNFEWSHGYSKRFGIIHVNYETQKRTIKSSGRYYARVISTNGSALEE